jgi:hypothetical protein
MFAIVRPELFFDNGGDHFVKESKVVEKIHKHDHMNSSIEAGNVTSLCVHPATGTNQ